MSNAPKQNLSTPDIPASAAVFTVSATIRINASAALVFSTLRNTETWKDWNRFVPRVTITHQPPDTEDATQGEIEEIVRNTSIAGSMDSDITEGVGLSGSSTRRPKTPEGPGPVIRQRLASNASRLSTQSTSEKDSTSIAAVAAQAAATTNGVQSAEATTSEKPATPTKPSESITDTTPPPRRRGSLAAAPPSGPVRGLSLLALYGEPSVRLQPGTKMTFHVCMKLPFVMHPTNDIIMIVNEVSRPPSELDDKNPFSNPFSSPENQIQKSLTHTTSPKSASPLYRIVWSMSSNYDPPKSFPKFLLQTQRVHEIRPIVGGDGRDDVMCEYRSWECQRGMLAKRVAKRHEKYLQEKFVLWNKGIKDFCETMGGAVERRDFSVSK